MGLEVGISFLISKHGFLTLILHHQNLVTMVVVYYRVLGQRETKLKWGLKMSLKGSVIIVLREETGRGIMVNVLQESEEAVAFYRRKTVVAIVENCKGDKDE